MTLTPPSSSFSLGQWWKRQRKSILLPMLGIGGFLLFWQLSSSLGLTKLTGPLSLWTDERTRELLLYPFFDRGGLDKGLFHHSMSSLARVAIGYTLAALVGIGWALPWASTNPLIGPLIPSSSFCVWWRPWPGCRSPWCCFRETSQRPFS